MIKRKGLLNLFDALNRISMKESWTLWVEGDGPELNQYKKLASKLNIKEQIRFLGFCQYDLHSWLIRTSTIVIVPSLEDNWGIVVDEGIQLGKVVISTFSTGAACDRLIDNVNGFIYQKDNIDYLSEKLGDLILNKDKIKRIGSAALKNKKTKTPLNNLDSILTLV